MRWASTEASAASVPAPGKLAASRTSALARASGRRWRFIAAPKAPRRSARGKTTRLVAAVIAMVLNLTQRAQAHRGVDFVLAHHHRLGTEALDDGAHKGADLRAGQQ